MLPGAEHRLARPDVHEHPLVDFIEIERLRGDVLEVPVQDAGAGVDGHRGVGVERRVAPGHAAADRGPRLGLRHPEVDPVEVRVVAARDPGVAAGAQVVRELRPGVAARLVRPRRRVEAPALLPRRRVVAADEARLAREAVAAAQPLHERPAGHERPARVAEAVRVIGDGRLPDLLAGPGVEGDEARVGRGQEEPLAVDGEVAARPGVAGRVDRHPVLPDEVAGGRVEGLHDRADPGHVEHAVVGDGRGGVPAALGEGPDPGQLQVADVAAVDVGQPAVAPGLVVAPDHQPVVRIRVAQHGVGDRPIAVDGAGRGDSGLARAGGRSRGTGRGRRGPRRRGRRWDGGVRTRCRGSLRPRRIRSARQRGDGDGRARVERRLPRGRAVRLEHVGHDLDVGRIAEGARPVGRHRQPHPVEEIARGQVAPELQEARPRQRRGLEAPLQVRLVADGALARVAGAPSFGLRRGVEGGSDLLPRRHRIRRAPERGSAGQPNGREPHPIVPSSSHHAICRFPGAAQPFAGSRGTRQVPGGAAGCDRPRRRAPTSGEGGRYGFSSAARSSSRRWPARMPSML